MASPSWNPSSGSDAAGAIFSRAVPFSLAIWLFSVPSKRRLSEFGEGIH